MTEHARRAAQRSRLLELLRSAGDRGVSVLDLIHDHHILRASGRILELRRDGYVIETRPGPGGTAIYALLAEPPLKDPPARVPQPSVSPRFGRPPPVTVQQRLF